MSLIENNNVFWFNNYKILFDNYTKFFPTFDMSREQQLNSITRFSFYLLMLLLFFKYNHKWLYLPITLIALTVVLYHIDSNDKNGKHKKLDRELQKRQNIVDENEKINKYLYEVDDEPNEVFPLDTDTDTNTNNISVESGYYDTNGNLITGKKTKPPKYEPTKKESLYTLDELEQYRKDSCRKPTRNNPFMNPNLTDYNNGDPPAACNMDDDGIKEEIVVNFNDNLYRNVEDLWEKKNSQRQFFTLPSTSIPNNQKEFANWLYKNPSTCKEEQTNCLRYEDLRFKR